MIVDNCWLKKKKFDSFKFKIQMKTWLISSLYCTKPKSEKNCCKKTNHKLGYQIKERKILSNFLFFSVSKSFFLIFYRKF